MEINKKREVTLYSILLKYIFSFCILTFVALLFSICIFMISIRTGLVWRADYAQNNVEELKNNLLENKVFDKNNIPFPYSYGFYNQQFELISSNFNNKQLRESLYYLKGNKIKSNYIYNVLELDNGVCVISYDIKTHFSIEYLDNILPYPEVITIIIFLILFIIFSSRLSYIFVKRLKKELNPLKTYTQFIMKKDLDFEIEPTGIKEFNEILISIENMKCELKKSLEQQWYSDQKRKEQISILAHDIKTPLTIIKGNAELLSEYQLIDEYDEYINFIIKNTDKIEDYISMLINIAKSENDIDYKIELIEFDKFLQEFRYEFNMMCISKKVKGRMKVKFYPKNFKGNKPLLIRALTNIIINAIEHSNEGDEIEVEINGNNNYLLFSVKDCGIGFTKQGLKNATNKFYMENSERNVENHYGIGLYIAQTIAKNHGGEVLLKNRNDRQGAEVSLIISLEL